MKSVIKLLASAQITCVQNFKPENAAMFILEFSCDLN